MSDGVLIAVEIFHPRRAYQPWPRPDGLLARAVDMLPSIEDDGIAKLVEQLALMIVEGQKQLRAVRALQAEALGQLHELHAETCLERLQPLSLQAFTLAAHTDIDVDPIRWPRDRGRRPIAKLLERVEATGTDTRLAKRARRSSAGRVLGEAA